MTAPRTSDRRPQVARDLRKPVRRGPPRGGRARRRRPRRCRSPSRRCGSASAHSPTAAHHDRVQRQQVCRRGTASARTRTSCPTATATPRPRIRSGRRAARRRVARGSRTRLHWGVATMKAARASQSHRCRRSTAAAEASATNRISIVPAVAHDVGENRCTQPAEDAQRGDPARLPADRECGRDRSDPDGEEDREQLRHELVHLCRDRDGHEQARDAGRDGGEGGVGTRLGLVEPHAGPSSPPQTAAAIQRRGRPRLSSRSRSRVRTERRCRAARRRRPPRRAGDRPRDPRGPRA